MRYTVSHRGCPLAYSVRGEGPPVLLIQGVGVHGDGWLPQVDGLAGRYRCVSFDNRGMGISKPVGDAPITVEQMAEDARAVMDAAGVEAAHVVGHSLGGLVALHLALTARPRVRSLALLCTFGRGRDAAPLTPGMLWWGMRTRVGTRRMRRYAFLRLVMPADALAKTDPDALAEELAPLFGHDLADQPPIVGRQLKAMRAYDAFPRLGELAGLPTLVVSATHDRIAPPKAGKALAAAIEGAKFVEVTDAAHGLPLHKPDRVTATLAEHFESASIR